MIWFKSTFCLRQKKMVEEAEDFSRLHYLMQQSDYLTTFLLIHSTLSRILGIPNNKSQKSTKFSTKTQCTHTRECPQKLTQAWIIHRSPKSILIPTYPQNSKETMYKVNTQLSPVRVQIRAQFINNNSIKTTIPSVKRLALTRTRMITLDRSCRNLETESLRLHSPWVYLVILSSEEVKEESNYNNSSNSLSWWEGCYSITVHNHHLLLSSRLNYILGQR